MNAISKSTLFFLLKTAFFVFTFSSFTIANSLFIEDTTALYPPHVYLQKADSLTRITDLEKAIVYLQKAQSIYQKQMQWDAYVDCTSLLIRLYQDTHNIERFQKDIAFAMQIGKRYLHDNHPSMGEIYKQKAELFSGSLQLDSIDVYINKAIDIFVCEKNWEQYAWSKSLIGILAFYVGNYNKMECTLNEVFDIAETLSNEKSQLQLSAIVQQSLGALYSLRGDYDKSLEMSRKALLLRTKSSTGFKIDSNSIAGVYNNIGAIYFTKSDYEQSISFFEQSILLLEKIWGEKSIDCAEGYTNIGLAHLYQKEPKEALQYFDKSLKITHRNQDDREKRNTVNCYHNLSQSYFDLGKYDTSFYFAQQAFAINQVSKYNLDVTYDLLSSVHKKRGNYEEALQLNQKSLKIRRAKLGIRNPSVANSLRKIAEAYHGLNQLDTALAYCQKALVAVSLNFNDKDVAVNPTLDDVNDQDIFQKTLDLKGRLLKDVFLKDKVNINLLHNALETFELAIKVIDEMRHSFQQEASKHTLAANALPVYEQSIQTAIELRNWYQQTSNSSNEIVEIYLKKAFRFAEKNKATILLEAIKESKAKLFANIPSEILEREESLKRDMAFYERKLFEEKQKPEEKANQLKMSVWESKIFDLTQAYQGLSDTLERDYTDYYHLKYDVKVSSVEELQAQLQNKEEILLEYFVGKEKVYIFTIQSNSITINTVHDLSDLQEQLDILLNNLKVNPFDAKDKEKTYLAYLQSAHWIYENLVKKALPPQKQNEEIKELIVIPDGIMGYIPFETLLMKYPENIQKINFSLSHLDYFIEEYSVTYAYSSTLLMEGLENTSVEKPRNYVGFAPVFENSESLAKERSYGSCSAADLQKLEGSEREVKKLSEMMEGNIFLKEEATKQNFLDNGAEGRILHLATHACLNQADPMFNAIHFINDYLSTYELFNIRLDVDLAILSACNTGSGTLSHGEGIMSLSRGFLYAGCPSMVTSLWNVNDQAAVDIMLSLHANLFEGQSKNNALRSAKIQYLQSKPNRLLAPFFWATFVHIGNPSPIVLSPIPSYSWWITLPFIFLIIICGYKFSKK